jgi:pSer/pThr/pTyr-binding forkhead associated (FHA) protein
VLTCKTCGAALDLAMSDCPECGAGVELGRLTGILGIVCRACDAYNDPGARSCVSCGKPIGAAAQPAPAAAAPPAPPPATPASAATAPPAPALTPAPSHIAAQAHPRAPARPTVPALGAAPAPGATPGRVRPPANPGEIPILTPVMVPGLANLPPTPPPGARPASLPPAPDAPVVRTFQKGSSGPTRMFSLPRSASTGSTPCPRCGEAPGHGQFCQRCGQPLGPQTTPAPRPAPAAAVEPPEASAPASGRARLHLERGEGPEGVVFRLAADVVEAGRSKGQVVFPADPCLAPHHATFFYRDGSLHVRDEGAAGGIYLRLRGPSAPLRLGDLFAVGDRLLRFAGLLPPPPAGPPDGTRRLGAPRHGGPTAVVEEWLEGGVVGRVFVRPGPSITIGRAGCAICLGDDAHLSQAHAELVLEGEQGARLRDLGSSNGTYLRVPAHAERELYDGDGLRIGREVLRVSIG